MTAPTWTQLDDRLLNKTYVFDLRVQRLRSPDGGYEDDFFYIASRDWVNIIPITKDRQVVLVDQFRHGINERSLETPGGIVDADDPEPMKTAVRELEEETGYVPGSVLSLGTVRPNPAMLNNTCHIFAALDCERSGKQHLEPTEDITVHLVPLLELPRLIRTGEIGHSVVSSACFLLWTQYPELVRP